MVFEHLLESQMKGGNHSESNSNGLPHIELLICSRPCSNCFLDINSFNSQKMKFTYTYIYVYIHMYIYIYYCLYFTVDEPKDLSCLVHCLRSHSRQAMETEFESRQFSCRICTFNHSTIQSWVLNGIEDRMAQLNSGHMKCPLSRREALQPCPSAFIPQNNPQADKTRSITHIYI